MDVLLDLTSEDNFLLSLAYQGVLLKHGSMENFNDYIEDNLSGDSYDNAIVAMAEIGRWLKETSLFLTEKQ